MIGIVPGTNKTFSVADYFCEKPVEGNLYIDPVSKRIFYYSEKETRSCPTTEFFPVWDGKTKYISKFSVTKYEKDVIPMDINVMGKSINKEMAEQITENLKKCNSLNPLEPEIDPNDNIFTKCVKGVILNKGLALQDLVEMSQPQMDEKAIGVFYSSLVKTSYMRLDKWDVWVMNILHIEYDISIFDGDELLVKYHCPSNEFSCIDEDILSETECNDPLKQIVKILIKLKDITKDQFKSDDIDEYTVNNMFTIINSNKKLSGQIFSRFVSMAELACKIDVYMDGELIYSLEE